MPEVIDNFVHEKVAQEIYDSVTNSFSLSSYKSTCCYDSKLDRNSAFDYEAEAEFLFAQYFNIDKSKHHFYINSFLICQFRPIFTSWSPHNLLICVHPSDLSFKEIRHGR